MSLRALGGAVLLGNNLARFVYLDEAGISSHRQEPWLVVAGLLVHADTQLNKVYTELAAVVERHIPEKSREGLVLHSSDIYGGNGKVFDESRNPEWTFDRRMAILEDLAKIPNKANILVTGMSIERAKFPSFLEIPVSLEKERRKRGGQKPPTLTVQAHAAAYIACLLEVDVWLRKNARNENCMVIVEDNNEARAAIREVHRYHQSKSMPLTEDLKSHFPLRRIKEDPAFQEKKPDHPLVLADFVAFVIKRLRMKDPRISPLFEPWKARFAALASTKGDPPRD
jgi:hypothetical protein